MVFDMVFFIERVRNIERERERERERKRERKRERRKEGKKEGILLALILVFTCLYHFTLLYFTLSLPLPASYLVKTK